MLATASDRSYADQIASHLDLFDEVMASDGEVNLGSEAKARALVQRFGEQGFEYAADRAADEPVWCHAAKAHIVGGGERLRQRVAAHTPIGETFERRRGGLLCAVRVHQWVKNLLVLVPVILAHRLTDPHALLAAFAAFVLFSMTASGVYLLNDLADLDADRRHHAKRNRPLASGQLPLPVAWALWPLLLVLPIVLGAMLLPLGFTLTLAVYVALTLGYTFGLKAKPVLDVVVLGLLYTLRFVAGVMVIDAPMTFWFLAFSLFFFLSLALMKRCEELVMVKARDPEHQLSRRGYRAVDAEPITALGVATGVVSVMILALYINDPKVIASYATPWLLWPLVPLLLYWVSRVWLLVYRGEVHDDPVLFTLKDRTSWVIGVLAGLVWLLATVVHL